VEVSPSTTRELNRLQPPTPHGVGFLFFIKIVSMGQTFFLRNVMDSIVLQGQIIRVNRLGNSVKSVKIVASKGARRFQITISSILLNSFPKVCLRLNQRVVVVMDKECSKVYSVKAVPADRSTRPDYGAMSNPSFLKRLFQRLL
jgi:hypothetical protein